MKTGQQLFEEHRQRIERAIKMEKNDRVPIMLGADAFCVRYAGGKLGDLVRDVRRGNQTAIKGILALGDVDGNFAAGFYPPILGMSFMSKVLVPGRDFPDDMLWQVQEVGLMTEADYDTILKAGWNPFFAGFCRDRLGDPMKEVTYFQQFVPAIAQDYLDAGVFPLFSAMVLPPYEMLCPGRGMARFFRDLRRMPEKVVAVMDVMMEDFVADLRKQIRTAKAFAGFIGASRGAGGFLSPKDFERFLWPYFKKLVEVMVEEGAYAYLHLDLNWGRLLNYFLELPKAKCIFHPDSTTDIFKAAAVLKGHMCFCGDVSPALLTVDSAQNVHNYCRRLIEEVGPDGFIMAAGCSVPFNAKPENVQAMVDVALNSGRPDRVAFH
jgi:uroporphyrinogen decarboxylase